MEFCVLRPIRTVAAAAALFESLGSLLSSHRALARVSIAALSFTVVIAFSQQAPVTVAGPEPAPVVTESMLPQNVGIGVTTDASITIDFDAAMNPGSVEDHLQILPDDAVRASWNQDLDQLKLTPEQRWRTDETYLVVVGGEAVATDGGALSQAHRFSFTTQTAPRVTDFQVRLAETATAAASVDTPLDAAAAKAAPDVALVNPPSKTATEVSATSAISVSFSGDMDHADVEERFAITPAVEGDIEWIANDLVFRPSGRLEPGSRYTISVIGAHDRLGNVVGGKGNFSFIVQPGAQVTKTTPEAEAAGVEPTTVELWFSQPMAVEATNKVFGLTDDATGQLVGGLLNWNEAATQLVYTPDRPLAGGRSYTVAFDGGAARCRWQRRQGRPVVHDQGGAGAGGGGSRGNVGAQRTGRAGGGTSNQPGGLRPQPGQRCPGRIRLRTGGPRRGSLRSRLIPCLGPGDERLLQPHRCQRQHPRVPAPCRRRRVQLVRREPVLSRRDEPAGDARLVPRAVHG